MLISLAREGGGDEGGDVGGAGVFRVREGDRNLECCAVHDLDERAPATDLENFLAVEAHGQNGTHTMETVRAGSCLPARILSCIAGLSLGLAV